MRWLLAASCLVFVPRSAEPCAVAPPDLGARIQVADEEALIVWDASTQTESFIRRAAFHSDAKAFGFLVPTPTVPKLSEVDDGLFRALGEATACKVEYRTERPLQLGSWLLDTCGMRADKSAPAGIAQDSVHVIQTTNVAGFDATSVQADDPHALARWLGDHGFVSTHELEDWLARYVTDKWTITAFVVAGTQAQPDVATRAINMTFATPHPFYPYREPATTLAPTGPRTLIVYTASSQRLAATLANAPWSASVPYAHAVTPSSINAVLGTQGFLTKFYDDSSPRRGIDEVYFAPAAGLKDVEPPPYVVIEKEPITIPLDMIALVGFGTLWFVRRRRRKA